MYSNSELDLQVRRHFAWMESFGISISTASHDRVDLVGESVVFRLVFSFDLPRLFGMVERSDHRLDAYDVWEYLVKRRRKDIESCFREAPVDSSMSECNEVMLEVISCAVRSVASDILSGDRKWMREHPSAPEIFEL